MGVKNTWKRRVEQVPLIEPAKKAFTIGLNPAARSRPDIVLGLVTHLNSQKLDRESRKAACDGQAESLWASIRVVLILSAHRDVRETCEIKFWGGIVRLM